MSVINKVLKDLDRRGQQPFSKNAASSAVERPGRSRFGAWFLGAALLGVLIVVAVWWQLPEKNVMTVHESTQTKPVKTKETAAPSENTVEVEETPDLVESSEPLLPRESSPESSVSRSTASVQSESSPEPELATTRNDSSGVSKESEKQTKNKETTDKSSGEFSLQPVQLSPAEIAAQHIGKAQKAQQQGRLTAAEEHWSKALLATPKNKDVRKKLAALQFGRNKVSQALTTLEAGFQMAPADYEFRLLSARILEKEAKPAAALSLLKQATPNAEVYPGYFQKQALLAQEVGDYPSAAQAYQRLVEADPAEGRWYLGLAIAQQQFAPGAALSSYQEALKRIEHKPTLDFIQQQVELLTTTNQAGKE